MLLLMLETLVLLGAVAVYPALRMVTPTSFGVYPVEWGPILLLTRVGRELWVLLLIRAVLWQRLRFLFVLLQVWV